MVVGEIFSETGQEGFLLVREFVVYLGDDMSGTGITLLDGVVRVHCCRLDEFLFEVLFLGIDYACLA